MIDKHLLSLYLKFSHPLAFYFLNVYFSIRIYSMTQITFNNLKLYNL